eukprot:jgi/Mesen1/8081/ME000434S07329
MDPDHSKHYSGYVTVDEEKGKALFYWLVEVATGNAAEKPLTLWLAGDVKTAWCWLEGSHASLSLHCNFSVDFYDYYMNDFSLCSNVTATALNEMWIVGFGWNVLKYSEYDVESTVLGLYAYLLRAGIRIWVYSGDVDGVVPVAGTRKWIAKLRREGHLSHSKPWAPWYLNHQVGGHTEEYNDGAFTFVTVRNAGHEVPYTQPERALALFSSFLHGRALPSEAKSRRPAQEGHVAAS